MKEITIYHSPDADDAFMFYGLVSGAINEEGFDFKHSLCDIETLNHMTLRGETEVTAVSVHAYAHLGNRYVILRSGASMGGADYGPRLVSKKPFDILDGKTRTIAIPGALTSATLATRIYLRENGVNAELVNLNFDEVQKAVLSGEVDAGVIIHEGQITHHKEGLCTNLDLGSWWWKKTALPLPLGVNVARKDLGDQAICAVSRALKGTIEYSLAHRKEAIDYALTYGRGIDFAEADVFVGMYVNERTVDMGEEGEKSIRQFLALGSDYGFIPKGVDVEFADA